MIDADTHTVQVRLKQLDQTLREGAKPAVDPTEQIARLVPRRNVETWILSLNGQAVEEETDYKGTRDDWFKSIPPAAKVLIQWVRSKDEPPGHCVDSLLNGVRELRRLNF